VRKRETHLKRSFRRETFLLKEFLSCEVVRSEAP